MVRLNSLGERTPPNAEALSVALTRLGDSMQLRDAEERVPRSKESGSWTFNESEIWTHLLEQRAQRFLRWPVIERTMSVPPSSKWLSEELYYLRTLESWETRWKPALQESLVGSPRRFRAMPESSANLVHHAYHVARFEEATGTSPVEFDTVVEFGAGYGSMCKLIHQLGFKGNYIILDLLPLIMLQDFYLTAIGLINHPIGGDEANVVLIPTSEAHEEFLSAISSPLVIATWSLSEADAQTRSSLLPLLFQSSGMLAAYQERFDSLDNIQFFNELATLRPWKVATSLSISHLPGNYYQFLLAG